MWHFQGEHSDICLLTIVDDIIISETDGHQEITERIFALLRSRFDMTTERDPTHFAGMRLSRNRRARATLQKYLAYNEAHYAVIVHNLIIRLLIRLCPYSN